MAFLQTPNQRTGSLSQHGPSEPCIWPRWHACSMKSSERLKRVMSEAEACLWKNEFRGLASLEHRAFWAAGTLVTLYKVALVLRNKCPGCRPRPGAQRFGLSVFFISCGPGHRPVSKGSFYNWPSAPSAAGPSSK